MRVFIDLNSRAFVVSPVLTERVTELLFTRRDVVPVEVQFVRNGVVVELPGGATGAMGIKKTFAGSFLANDTGFNKTGTGTSAVYTFDLNLNTTEMNAEFTTDLEESIAARVEISWSFDGTTSSTLPTAATIFNDVIRGTEGAPNFATVLSQFDLRSPDNSTWRITVDDDGSLAASKQ